jgi:hypothetical protein
MATGITGKPLVRKDAKRQATVRVAARLPFIARA